MWFQEIESCLEMIEVSFWTPCCQVELDLQIHRKIEPQKLLRGKLPEQSVRETASLSDALGVKWSTVALYSCRTVYQIFDDRQSRLQFPVADVWIAEIGLKIFESRLFRLSNDYHFFEVASQRWSATTSMCLWGNSLHSSVMPNKILLCSNHREDRNQWLNDIRTFKIVRVRLSYQFQYVTASLITRTTNIGT